MENVLITLCYNDADISIEYLRKVSKYSSINKIIVVDNGSKQDIFKLLKQEIIELNNDKIILLRSDVNLGYAKGNNIGIKYAVNILNPKNIFITNTDVDYSSKTIEAVTEFLNCNANVGLVSPRMKMPDNSPCLTAWKLPNYFMALWNSFFILKRLYNPQKYKDLNYRVCKVDVLPGSFLAAKADLWKKIQGFDEDTFLYGEESLLAYKVLKNNKANYLLNDIFYIHNHSSIINRNIKSFRKKMKLLYEANYIYNKKCLKVNKFQEGIYKYAFKFNVICSSIYMMFRR